MSHITYGVVKDWTNAHELIQNRIAVVNQLHGCRYDNGATNPCKLRSCGDVYIALYCGVAVASWKLYDVESARYALSHVDRLQDVIWQGRRTGYLRLMAGF